ncbi:MAG: FAD-dependent oxidoreductase, partial [Paracoccaceae bacterium]
MAGRADIAVVGAGAFGLSIALEAARRGARVVVLDAAAPGAGASATPTGALVPFPRAAPGDPLAKLQAEGLCAMPAFARRLAEATGR